MASSYRKMVMRGRNAVAWLNFLAASAVSAVFTVGIWYKGAEVAYIVVSFTPAIVAVALAVIIGPPLWVRLAAAEGQFHPARGAVAGALTVLLVHLITIEIFLIIGFILMKITGESQMYVDEVPWLMVQAPVLSLYRLGWLTLPAGIAIGWGVAVWCKRRMV
jgi:hypothetical protein